MKVYIKSSLQHGRGVFARDQIRAGEPILTFSGPLLNRAEVREEDYHLQVDADLYLGASGEADDYVNHSCEPNAGFRDGLVLVARRDIGCGGGDHLGLQHGHRRGRFSGICLFLWCNRLPRRGPFFPPSRS